MFSRLSNVKKYNHLSEKLSNAEGKKEISNSNYNPTFVNTKSKTVPTVFSKDDTQDEDDLEDEIEEKKIKKEMEEMDEMEENEKEKDELTLPSLPSFFSNMIGSSSSSLTKEKEKGEEKEQEEEEEEEEEEEQEEEQDAEFILDEPDIVMQGVPYYYLNDTKDFMNDTLTREWVDFLEERSEKEIEIQVAIYKLNDSIHHVPFVTYLLEKNASNMYAFPRVTIPLLNEDKEKGKDVEDILNYTCDKECKKRVFHHLRILPNKRFLTSRTLDHLVFKGYITGKKSNEILAVFETKNHFPDIRENCEWVTLHEIVNTKFIHSYTIHPLVSIWFLENSGLIYIKDKYNKPVEIPYVLYLLENMDSIQKGGGKEEKSSSVFDFLPQIPPISVPDIFSSKTEEGKEEEKSQSSIRNNVSKYQSIQTDYGLLPESVKHPVLGDIFLFSEKGTEIARNVVFITNTVYLLDQPPDFSLYLEAKKNYDSIYFQEDGEPIWGVENALFFGNQF